LYPQHLARLNDSRTALFDKFDGYDISDELYPPESWCGTNTTLSKLDISKPLPEELKGKYDVVHLRCFMTIASDDNVDVVIENLKRMLSKCNLSAGSLDRGTGA